MDAWNARKTNHPQDEEEGRGSFLGGTEGAFGLFIVIEWASSNLKRLDGAEPPKTYGVTRGAIHHVFI